MSVEHVLYIITVWNTKVKSIATEIHSVHVVGMLNFSRWNFTKYVCIHLNGVKYILNAKLVPLLQLALHSLTELFVRNDNIFLLRKENNFTNNGAIAIAIAC